ncbi:MAG: hypothetical protein IKD01_05265 [Oscillospiraceae bacterium]|nr:hypothetical protein [Oscillospiraceae bacterium]
MADRRMLTKKVTDDEHFINLSSSAQALYLHLSMSADDDGFCNQISVSMFKAHASVQDLESLLKLRYIYQFESGVIVIKHWRMANALRKDRYTPTAFQEELAKLQLKDNGAYTMKDNGCQSVASCLPQVRLGKDRLEKDNTPPIPPPGGKAVEIPFTGELREAFDDWIAYKKEKHQTYKTRGLKSLITQIQRYAQQFGDIETADAIRNSMASNYAGIVFDRIGKSHQSRPQTPKQYSKGGFLDE